MRDTRLITVRDLKEFKRDVLLAVGVIVLLVAMVIVFLDVTASEVPLP